MIAELLDAFGIATAAPRASKPTTSWAPPRPPNTGSVMSSAATDLLQLVADEAVPVRVLYLGRGLSNAVMFGPGEVAERWCPRTPGGAAYAELALLRGRSLRRFARRSGSRRKTAIRCWQVRIV